MVVDPWAKVITQAKEHEETLHTVIGKTSLNLILKPVWMLKNTIETRPPLNKLVDILHLDFDLIQKYRTEIPTFKQRRTDIYDVIAK